MLWLLLLFSLLYFLSLLNVLRCVEVVFEFEHCETCVDDRSRCVSGRRIEVSLWAFWIISVCCCCGYVLRDVARLCCDFECESELLKLMMHNGFFEIELNWCGQSIEWGMRSSEWEFFCWGFGRRKRRFFVERVSLLSSCRLIGFLFSCVIPFFFLYDAGPCSAAFFGLIYATTVPYLWIKWSPNSLYSLVSFLSLLYEFCTTAL